MQANKVDLLTSPWADSFHELLSMAENDLILASPYITHQGLEMVKKAVEKFPSSSRPNTHVITNLKLDNMLSRSVDVSALANFVEQVPNAKVSYLPSLHAKIYVADDKLAVVTSANLTGQGLYQNQEYGVLLSCPNLVGKVRAHANKLFSLGNVVSPDSLIMLADQVDKMQQTYRDMQRSARRKLKELLQQQQEQTQLQLFEVRAEGMTTHAILCRTILYLLEQHGPLPTRELNPLVQQLHPDICDDTEDRIIRGVHFGKKWKHHVRNAQVSLRRKGLIVAAEKRWALTEKATAMGETMFV